MEKLPNGVRDVDLENPPARMSAVTLADAPMSPIARDRYRVTVVFRHPIEAAGFSREQLKSVSAEGDSALRVPGGTATFVAEDSQVEGGELRINLEANTVGRLGRAVAEVTVDGAPLARRIVTAQLGAILARLAFETDALIAVHWIEVVAVSSGHTERGFVYRGDDSILDRWPTWKHHEPDFFRSAYAVYRDGLNSTNPFWSLLCFIRVIEGARAYRAKAMKLAKDRGLSLTRPKLELQNDPMIVPPFRDWIGKNVFWVAEQLHIEFRVPLAHGVSPDEPMHAADQIGVEGRHWLARPVAHQIARSLLRDTREIRDLFGDEPLAELDKAKFA
jgi:hypothetical protein